LVLSTPINEQEGSMKLPGTICPEKQITSDVKTNALEPLSQRVGLSRNAVEAALMQTMSVTDPQDWPVNLAHNTAQTVTYLRETLCQV
jgi:hypothetical protein